MKRSFDWSLMLRLAMRDLRGGLRGFSVFVICVALGVAVIAAVGVVSDSLTAGFSAEGRQMLGGDVAVSRVHGRAQPAELGELKALGAVSEIATMRGMAQGPATTDGARIMVEIKAVDQAYPLAGALVGHQLKDGSDVVHDDRSILVAPILLERLSVRVGDTIRIGSKDFKIVDTIAKEPDGLTARATFGPRVIMSLAALEATELLGPGGLVRWRYRVALNESSSTGARGNFETTVGAVRDAFVSRGFTVRDRRDPAPGITAGIDRFRQFLTLVGLTAMLVGGVGVANAVSSYLDGRASTIATFRAIGAERRMVFAVYLAEILIIAALGVGLGLVVGLGIPWVGWSIFGGGSALPVQLSVSMATVGVAVAYGFLVSLAFVLWPLGRVDQVRPAMLFRDTVSPVRSWPRPIIFAAIAIVIGALVLLTIAGSGQRIVAFGFFAGIAALFLVFLTLAWIIRLLAGALPRFGPAEFVLAVRNLAGPGALTQPIVLSLGTGLTLLVAVTLTDASLTKELTTRLPTQAPSFYFLDVNKTVAEEFRTTVLDVAPEGKLRDAPMLRGRVTALRGKRADEVKATPDAAWVLNGDRGLTFSASVPEGSELVEGEWWPSDYDGPPLLSFEADLAKGLGLKIGDPVTVNVLGRPITATIANLRRVDWGSLSINFVLIYSPNTLQAAPFNYLYTLTYPALPTVAAEAAVLKSVGKAFPGVTAIRVRDAIDAAAKILDRIMLAVRALGGLTLFVGAVVLAGAVTTTQQRRIKQSVLLKTLGATRSRVMRTGLFEFVILGLAVALVAILLGTLGAWIMTERVMEVSFSFAWQAVAEAVLVALLLTVLFGYFSLRRVLKAPSVPYLRST